MHVELDNPYSGFLRQFRCTRVIGLYREIAIAIQKESGDSNGGNV